MSDCKDDYPVCVRPIDDRKGKVTNEHAPSPSRCGRTGERERKRASSSLLNSRYETRTVAGSGLFVVGNLRQKLMRRDADKASPLHLMNRRASANTSSAK